MELKPCPFCGNKATVYIVTQNRLSFWRVQCAECSAVMQAMTRENAIVIWNTRPVEDTLLACIANARTIIERGVELMTPDQVGQWEGVRSWLEMAPYTPDMLEHEP